MEGVGSMSGMAEHGWNVRAATSCGYILAHGKPQLETCLE